MALKINGESAVSNPQTYETEVATSAARQIVDHAVEMRQMYQAALVNASIPGVAQAAVATRGIAGIGTAAKKVYEGTQTAAHLTCEGSTNKALGIAASSRANFAVVSAASQKTDKGVRASVVPVRQTTVEVTSSPPQNPMLERANKLNNASDAMNRVVQRFEEILKGLSLGVSAWVKVRDEQDEDGNCILEELGYTRVGSRWAVALKATEGMFGELGDEKFWSFVDAPRELRIRAVDRLPSLMKELDAQAEELTDRLLEKVSSLSDFAAELEKQTGRAK